MRIACGISVKINEFSANCKDLNARESFFKMNDVEERENGKEMENCAIDVTIIPQLWSVVRNNTYYIGVRDIFRESREKNIISTNKN